MPHANREERQKILDRIGQAVARLRQEGALQPGDLDALRSDLALAAPEFETGSAQSSVPERAQAEAYRRHLEELDRILPSIYTRLLAERARLEARREQAAGAAAWAEASQETL